MAELRCDMRMMPKRLKRCDGDLTVEQEDRISNLHDVLLAQILSLLPTKEAVATSVLSRRWRHVFTWITRFDFDDSPISHCIRSPRMIHAFPAFKMFVHNVLQACKAEQITTFRLNLGKDSSNLDSRCVPKRFPRFLFGANEESRFKSRGCSEECVPEIDPMSSLRAWLSFPIVRGVRVLDLWVRVRKPFKLPSIVFCCQTLEVLKLDTNLDLEVPLSVCLPNLTEFHFTSPFLPGDDSLTRLVSSCPILEQLKLKCTIESVLPVNIASQSLRRLVLDVRPSWHERLPIRSKLLLDVPNLEYLWYHDNLAVVYSINNLNALVEAEVIVVCEFSDPEDVRCLVSSLCNVHRLELSSECVEAMLKCEAMHELPVFRNLIHLQLGCSGFYKWSDLLVELFDCAPSLTTLEFIEGIACSADETCVNFNPYKVFADDCLMLGSLETTPSCFKFHLKNIIIKRYHLSRHELKMVKYFLRSALVLEELIVVCETSVPMADRVSFGTTLQRVPRSSVTCSIKVQ